ncbi:MAG: BON domain-containing protein [Ottowia sp.]|uniref:BON domain-containing protein n=1 Tax=Ottowia sp. TaxID=1898956 RepID=UPI001DA20A5D|nr:BON domain-containing protein [Ottowia sp.]MCP5256957.1 BON domain-containing protein [Burkholderiaceae bacterium]MCB2025540.1 BON domain-containing protein [Ottowia sp.]MCB2071002.1 BON domain-containing protein [Ottowia sp.]HPK30946.1 BON domain-containing protein [Ottowia sp.]HPR43205.1 BON domain-containing protein [Ottowia sp.]
MKALRTLIIAAMTGLTLVATGCSVFRGQQSAGSYVDDAAITTAVKAKFVEDKTVDAGAINVQTLNGEVSLAGFAKSAEEKAKAEQLARGVNGVRSVRNSLVIR